MKHRIMFVCHGNICRSTMAEYVMKHLVREQGLEQAFWIASSGTSREEIGNDVHHGTRRKLSQMGICVGHRQAVQLTRADYDAYDYIVVMDGMNLRNTMRIMGNDPEQKISMLLDHAGRMGEGIADPWYTGNFDDTYHDVMEGCEAMLLMINEKYNV